MAKPHWTDTYKTTPIRVWVSPNVIRQDSARHPFRNELKGVGSDAEERDNVLMFQTFPHDSLLVEGLWEGPLSTPLRRDNRTAYSFGVHPTVLVGIYPNTFDANL